MRHTPTPGISGSRDPQLIAHYARRVFATTIATQYLRAAREHLRNTAANQAADAVARALKSVIGARNHAMRMVSHLERVTRRHRQEDPHCTCTACLAYTDAMQYLATMRAIVDRLPDEPRS